MVFHAGLGPKGHNSHHMLGGLTSADGIPLFGHFARVYFRNATIVNSVAKKGSLHCKNETKKRAISSLIALKEQFFAPDIWRKISHKQTLLEEILKLHRIAKKKFFSRVKW